LPVRGDIDLGALAPPALKPIIPTPPPALPFARTGGSVVRGAALRGLHRLDVANARKRRRAAGRWSCPCLERVLSRSCQRFHLELLGRFTRHKPPTRNGADRRARRAMARTLDDCKDKVRSRRYGTARSDIRTAKATADSALAIAASTSRAGLQQNRNVPCVWRNVCRPFLATDLDVPLRAPNVGPPPPYPA